MCNGNPNFFSLLQNCVRLTGSCWREVSIKLFRLQIILYVWGTGMRKLCNCMLVHITPTIARMLQLQIRLSVTGGLSPSDNKKNHVCQYISAPPHRLAWTSNIFYILFRGGKIWIAGCFLFYIHRATGKCSVLKLSSPCSCFIYHQKNCVLLQPLGMVCIVSFNATLQNCGSCQYKILTTPTFFHERWDFTKSAVQYELRFIWW